MENAGFGINFWIPLMTWNSDDFCGDVLDVCTPQDAGSWQTKVSSFGDSQAQKM